MRAGLGLLVPDARADPDATQRDPDAELRDERRLLERAALWLRVRVSVQLHADPDASGNADPDADADRHRDALPAVPALRAGGNADADSWAAARAGVLT